MTTDTILFAVYVIAVWIAYSTHGWLGAIVTFGAITVIMFITLVVNAYEDERAKRRHRERKEAAKKALNAHVFGGGCNLCESGQMCPEAQALAATLYGPMGWQRRPRR